MLIPAEAVQAHEESRDFVLEAQLILSIIPSSSSEATLIFLMNPVEELCLVAWMLSDFSSCRIREECSGMLDGRTVEPSRDLPLRVLDSAPSVGSRVSDVPTTRRVQVTRLSIQEHWSIPA